MRKNLRSFWGCTTLVRTWFQTCSLLNHERIHFHCMYQKLPPSLWQFVTTALGNQYNRLLKWFYSVLMASVPPIGLWHLVLKCLPGALSWVLDLCFQMAAETAERVDPNVLRAFSPALNLSLLHTCFPLNNVLSRLGHHQTPASPTLNLDGTQDYLSFSLPIFTWPLKPHNFPLEFFPVECWVRWRVCPARAQAIPTARDQSQTRVWVCQMPRALGRWGHTARSQFG